MTSESKIITKKLPEIYFCNVASHPKWNLNRFKKSQRKSCENTPVFKIISIWNGAHSAKLSREIGLFFSNLTFTLSVYATSS